MQLRITLLPVQVMPKRPRKRLTTNFGGFLPLRNTKGLLFQFEMAGFFVGQIGGLNKRFGPPQGRPEFMRKKTLLREGSKEYTLIQATLEREDSSASKACTARKV
jgi:hypothetical protein